MTTIGGPYHCCKHNIEGCPMCLYGDDAPDESPAAEPPTALTRRADRPLLPYEVDALREQLVTAEREREAEKSAHHRTNNARVQNMNECIALRAENTRLRAALTAELMQPCAACGILMAECGMCLDRRARIDAALAKDPTP